MGFENLNSGDINLAVTEIEGIKTQAMSLGGNDSEYSAFEAIIQSLKTGELLPKEAVSKAMSILESKQTYH